MNALLPSKPWLGIMLVTLVGTAGCAQSGAANSVSLTAPSSASNSAAALPIQPQVAPGASYDATGSWFGVLTLVNGTPFGSGTLALVQDADGNIVGTGVPANEDPHTYTFTRVSARGGTIVYRSSITAPAPGPSGCATDVSGVAELNIGTNTIEAHRVSGTVDDCSVVAFAVHLTRQ